MTYREANFQEILETLRERGFSDQTVADTVGLSQSQITRLRRGERFEPYYNAGVRIMRMYQQTAPIFSPRTMQSLISEKRVDKKA